VLNTVTLQFHCRCCHFRTKYDRLSHAKIAEERARRIL